MRDILIGDIHGCLEEFTELIGIIQPGRWDNVVLLGDLVDKGPDSAGVVAYANHLQKRTSITLLRGNHEEKHARYRRQVSAGAIPMMKNLEEIRLITSKLTEEDIGFLNTAQPYYQSRKFNYVAVHAGVLPSWSELPSSDPEAKLLGMIRYVSGKGQMVPLGKELPTDKFWADLYDGRFGHIYYGHQPYTGVDLMVHQHATGLDTGCVFGGSLSAIVLDGSGQELVQVLAKQKYATSYWDEHVNR